MAKQRSLKHLHHNHKQVQRPKKRETAHKLIVQVNLVRPLASLVFGRHHSTGHRMLAGVVVAAVGVFIVKHMGHHSNEYVGMVVDGVGYGLHGLGLTPFAEYLSESYATE